MLPDRHSLTSNLRLRRALLFAALGYGYVIAVLALLAGIIYLFGRLGLGNLAWYLLGGLVMFVATALLVHIASPEGRRVERAELPELFRLIDRARGELRAPPVDQVVINHEMNAGVLEERRYGIPGWTRRHLVLGLPLLHVLPADELRAILAHEFAHLSRQHSRSHRLLARAGVTWQVLVMGFSATFRWVSFLFVPFFRWYTPRLEALTQESSRAHEFESDRLATRVSGQAVMARALLRLHLWTSRMENEVLPAVYRGSLQADAPDASTFARLLEAIRAPLDPVEVSSGVGTVLREQTLARHSHPSVADRLAALGADPAAVGAALVETADGWRSAADELLGTSAVALADDVGAAWAKAIAPQWRQFRADALCWTEAERSLEDGTAPALSPEAVWSRARWATHCESPEVAIPLLRRVPESAEARVLLGMLLLRRDDAASHDEAVRILEEETRRATAFSLQANDALEAFYARAGWTRDVRRCRERRTELLRVMLRGVQERVSLSARDALRPYPLPPAMLAALAARLRDTEEVQAAYLVQKRPRHPGEPPALVLAVVIGGPWYRFTSGTFALEVCRRLLDELHLPEPLSLVTPVERGSWILRRLRGIPGAAVFRREGDTPPALPGAEWSRPWRIPAPTLAGVLMVCVLLAAANRVLTGSDSPPATSEAWAARISALREEVRDHPASASARRDLAWALVESGQKDEAGLALAEAVRLNPDDASLLNALGWWHIERDEYEESLPLLRRALRADPSNPNARHNLGWALLRLSRYVEAEAEYRETIRVHPERANAHSEFGWVLMGLHRNDEAEREFREAMRLDPNEYRSRQGLGLVLKARARLPEAIEAFRAAVLLYPEDADSWLQIAMLTHIRGDFRESASAFDTAIRLRPEYEHDPYVRAMREASRQGHFYEAPR